MKVLSVFTMLNSSVPFVMMSCLGGCAATCIGVRHAESGLWCVCVCVSMLALCFGLRLSMQQMLHVNGGSINHQQFDLSP